MCGRYKITKPISKTIDIVKTNIKVEDTNNYNAHPSQKLPIIKSYTNGKALELYEWGLVPNWSKKLDKFSPLINARRETLMEKITFKIRGSPRILSKAAYCPIAHKGLTTKANIKSTTIWCHRVWEVGCRRS